jgi:hypothetical protein
MPKVPVIPQNVEDFNDIVDYLQTNIFPQKYDTNTKRQNFKRRCKNFEFDLTSGHLYLRIPQNKNNPPSDTPLQPYNANRKRVVPAYDAELRKQLFEAFHDGKGHWNYHKTFTMIFNNHIGISEDDVRTYINNCPTCLRNTSIKERIDITPIVATGPMEHLQIDLIDLLMYANDNDGFSYILTIIDVFSKYLWAIPLPNKEAITIQKELVQLFTSFGPPGKLQADNGKEFVSEILKQTCEILKVYINIYILC